MNPHHSKTGRDSSHPGPPDDRNLPKTEPYSQPDLQFGRYRATRLLGRGGFGEVYLAEDEELGRLVAIKVTFHRYLDDAMRDSFLQEARFVAKLEHPHIVPVYDVGRTEHGDYFVVSKWIDGTDLAVRIQRDRPNRTTSVRIVEAIASALHAAHQREIVHRDVKPGNILLDRHDNPYLADFGIALRESEGVKIEHAAGTPAYMSPEQARGEGHRLDRRSDIYSLGVVLYELLTGRRPFRTENRQDLIQLIANEEVRPLRHFDDRIPIDLERICLKALARKPADRFSIAKDLADELKWWLDQSLLQANTPPATPPRAENSIESTTSNPATPPGSYPAKLSSLIMPSGPSKVVPKGLRSFDAGDADFFLDLLPGPYDRDGLPESLRFWKQRIEEHDKDRSFAVGLLYGPSGCGKSSMMKAGLLPRLAPIIHTVYLEASPEDTEEQLTRRIRKTLPDARGDTLTDLLANIRRKRLVPDRGKLLLVIDQFEQWLHAQTDLRTAPLTDALRQCDGTRIQCIVMIRDDFWLSVNRFLSELDVPLVENHNFKLVDLFSLDHAARVLSLFGQALGKLPSKHSLWSPGQRDFVKLAVEGLAEDRKVISIRLAVLADMMHSREWTSSTLEEVGGIAGVGLTFLEETFSARHAPADHRLYERAIRNVLKALLPENGADIKGHRLSQAQLQAAAEYSNQPKAWAHVLQILDPRLRLITPVDPRGLGFEDAIDHAPIVASTPSPDSIPEDPSTQYNQCITTANGHDNPGPSYQLTHDYLVPALREWLDRKQRETPAGRAQLQLEERATRWKSKPEPQQLPSILEWLSILRLTNRHRWTRDQHVMMRQAHWRYGLQLASLLLVMITLASGLLVARNALIHQRESLLAAQRRVQAIAESKRLVEGLLRADTSQLTLSLQSLEPLAEFAKPELTKAFQSESPNSISKFHAGIGLLNLSQEPEPTVLNEVAEGLLVTSPSNFEVPCLFLAKYGDRLAPLYWTVLDNPNSPAEKRLHAAAALARFAPDDERWNRPEYVAMVAKQWLSSNPLHASVWQKSFKPVRKALLEPIGALLRDVQQPEVTRSLATSALLEYAEGEGDFLAELLLDLDREPYSMLFPLLEQNRSSSLAKLEALLDEPPPSPWKALSNTFTWEDPAPQVAETLEAADGRLDAQWAFAFDLSPEKFSRLASELNPCGYRPVRIRPWSRCADPSNSAEPESLAVLWHRDGKRWTLETNLSRTRFPEPPTPMVNHGLVLEECGWWGQTAPGNIGPEPRYFALWGEPESDVDQRFAGLDLTLDDWTVARNSSDSRLLRSLHVRKANKSRRYSSVWQAGKSMTHEAFPEIHGEELRWRPQVDVGVAEVEECPDWKTHDLNILQQWELASPEEKKEIALREKVAEAMYRVGKTQDALVLLESLRSDGHDNEPSWRLLGLTHAKLGNREKAKQLWTSYDTKYANPILSTSMAIQISCFLGDVEQAKAALEGALNAQLQEQVQDGTRDPDYHLIRAAAQCAQFLSDHDPSNQQAFAELAINSLKNRFPQSSEALHALRVDPNLADIWQDPRLVDSLDQAESMGWFCGLYCVDPSIESRLWTSSSPSSNSIEPLKLNDFIEKNRSLGFRPISLAAANIRPSYAGHSKAHGERALLLARPRVPESRKEQWAKKRAKAAVALLRLKAPDKVWSLLRHQPDPRLRTYLIHYLAEYRMDPAIILTKLLAESDASAKLALVQILGEYARHSLLSESSKIRLQRVLLDLYSQHPDPGIHGSCEWSLRQVGATEAIDAARHAFATGKIVGDRDWYVTRQNEHTMMVIKPTPFWMGSPITETNRWEGAEGVEEAQHRRKIEHHFAMAAQETTVRQFQQFRQETYAINYAPTEECPMNGVSWFEAAEYCNWLSQREGIPREEWAFDPDQAFREGMTIPPDYVKRQGYRLPLECEWEFACRAGADTRFCFGDEIKMLKEYAHWLENTSGSQSFPVGILKNNDLGLFDMHGNAWEWVADAFVPSPTRSPCLPETGFGLLRRLNNAQDRVLRGGSFSSNVSNLRSANRDSDRPDGQDTNYGFRIVRTIP